MSDKVPTVLRPKANDLRLSLQIHKDHPHASASVSLEPGIQFKSISSRVWSLLL